MEDTHIAFFTLLMKLKQLHDSYSNFTIQDIVSVDQEIIAPLLEFGKDVDVLQKALEAKETPVTEMTWVKFIAVEGHKLRKKDPTMTQPQILQMLSPMWKERNQRD